MKLKVIEGHENYVATIVKLPPKQVVQGLDKLVKVTVFGNDVLVGKDTPQDDLYIFFPAECVINQEYLSGNNEFRHQNLNKDTTKKGFFEDSGRVKAIKFKGVISTGYLAPVMSLNHDLHVAPGIGTIFSEGDEFNEINGFELCRKYKPVRIQSTTEKGSRFNKKLKRFDRLVPNQFRFHQSTPQLAKCLNQFNPEDIIVITDKWHGTSAVFSNVLVKTELKWYQKLAAALVLPSIKKYLSFTSYDNIYSSRSVVKNQYINKNNNTNSNGGYYGEDIWGAVNKELVGKIEQGISIYGEIVGYLDSGKAIQKGYDYGCDPISTTVPNARIIGAGEHKFVVYRITYTKPDGSVIEFSWQQIKDYCKKYSLDTVKELFFGKPFQVYRERDYGEWLFDHLTRTYLEQDCKYCVNKMPTEGIVVRIDGKESFSAFKLKSKRFLEHETKQIDEEMKSGELNIEEDVTSN